MKLKGSNARKIRRRYREEDPLDPQLAAELRRIASRLVRYGGLPALYAPYRVWDEEAEEEVFQGWYAGRLVVVPEHVVHPGLLGGWWLSKTISPRRTPDEDSR